MLTPPSPTTLLGVPGDHEQVPRNHAPEGCRVGIEGLQHCSHPSLIKEPSVEAQVPDRERQSDDQHSRQDVEQTCRLLVLRSLTISLRDLPIEQKSTAKCEHRQKQRKAHRQLGAENDQRCNLPEDGSGVVNQSLTPNRRTEEDSSSEVTGNREPFWLERDVDVVRHLEHHYRAQNERHPSARTRH